MGVWEDVGMVVGEDVLLGVGDDVGLGVGVDIRLLFLVGEAIGFRVLEDIREDVRRIR